MENEIPLFNLGSKIRFFRELKGISQEAIAAQLGISQQAYQKLETGATKLNIERANQIAGQLALKLDFMLSFDPSNYWNNCTLSGNGTFNNYTEIPQELLKAHDEQVESLKSEILFLRALLGQKND